MERKTVSGMMLTLLLTSMLIMMFNVIPTAEENSGWDVFYSADKLPDDPTLEYPWILDETFVEDEGVAKVSDGILKLNTTSETEYWIYRRGWNANSSIGWIVEARVKIEAQDRSSQGFKFSDGSKRTYVEFETNRIRVLLSLEIGWTLIDVDNTFFRTYRIRLKNSDFKIYLDDALIFEGEATIETTENNIKFGKIWGGTNYGGISYWDYVAYKTTTPLPVHNIDTGLDYATIQEAIDAPETLNGHTIRVDAGTYYENVVVNKTVALIGENKSTTIIDAGDIGNVIEVTANNVHIHHFNIRNSGPDYPNSGVYVTSDGNNISSNIVMNNYCGIRLYYSDDNIISRNNITANDNLGLYIDLGSSNNSICENDINTNNNYGIYLYDYSSSNNLSGNNVTDNQYGIMLHSSANNMLRDNSMASNNYSFGVYASRISDYVHDIDSSNTVDERPVYYWINKKDMSVPAEAGYVGVINCTGMTIQNLSLNNNWQGLLLAYTTNSTIASNNITNNYRGIWLDESLNNTISRNNITVNDYFGLVFDESHNNTISTNEIAENKHGIGFEDSLNNTVSRNNITTNDFYGIYLDGSSNNIIDRNNIAENNDHGIWIEWYSDNNIISRNNVTANNYYGMHLWYASNNTVSENNIAANTYNGLRLESSSNNTITGNNISVNNARGIYLSWSSYNLIYHNSFVNNAIQAYVYDSPNNTWDNGYPSGGNYWSNYTGVDLDEDGIGDTPHVIDANNTDNFPLMNPWTELSDLGDCDGDWDVDYDDFIILAGAYGTSIGQPGYNARADFDNDGDIDYNDFIILAGNYGTNV